MEDEKSVAVASLLNLFVAPVGSIYCHGWIGAIGVIFFYIIVPSGFGFFVWLAGPIWALMGFFQCKAYNEKVRGRNIASLGSVIQQENSKNPLD